MDAKKAANLFRLTACVPTVMGGGYFVIVRFYKYSF